MKKLCMKLDIHQITERRDGDVFKTKPVGFIWVQMGIALPQQAGDFVFVSTTAPNEYKEIA